MAWRYVEARDADAPLWRRILGIWRHRRLLRRMAERDLRQRYVGSVIGYAWAAVYPLLFVAVYALIFTVVFRARLSPDAPVQEYAVYVISGLLPWIAFSEVAGRATQTMAEHRNLVKFAMFPVQILPLTSLYAASFSQAIGLVALLGLTVWVRGALPATAWLLVPALLLQAVFLAGISWMLGALGALLRDVKELVSIVLMVGMFLTPVFYLEADAPAPLRLLFAINPLAHLLRVYRDALVGDGTIHLLSLGIFGAVAVVTLFAGYLVFERTRAFLGDIL
jgi:lipopolysaccharide transport system permease protein